MISNISLISFIVIIVALTAVYCIARTCSLPSSFFKNQAQREGILKSKIKAAEELNERRRIKENFEKEAVAAEPDQNT